MTADALEPLCTIVTTDLSAITRGRPVPARDLDASAMTGVGWVPANASLTAFGAIADPNPWDRRATCASCPTWGPAIGPGSPAPRHPSIW